MESDFLQTVNITVKLGIFLSQWFYSVI